MTVMVTGVSTVMVLGHMTVMVTGHMTVFVTGYVPTIAARPCLWWPCLPVSGVA